MTSTPRARKTERIRSKLALAYPVLTVDAELSADEQTILLTARASVGSFTEVVDATLAYDEILREQRGYFDDLAADEQTARDMDRREVIQRAAVARGEVDLDAEAIAKAVREVDDATRALEAASARLERATYALKVARGRVSPPADPQGRRPGDVLIERSSRKEEWLVLDVRPSRRYGGDSGVEYLVRAVRFPNGLQRWLPAENFQNN